MYLAVKDIQNLAKSFSVYNVEMLVRKEELFQFAQTAITGLKVTGDIARIDFEISQIQQRLNGMKSQQSSIEGSEISSEATSSSTSSMDIEEPVTHIQLCCRLKSLLLKKQMLRKGDTIETHTQKELGAEMSVLEKQRDKLEAELREAAINFFKFIVNNTLTAANTRLQNAREERFQFDEDNNEFLLLLKEKEEELSSTIVSYRAEADTCHTFVNFLEATWTFHEQLQNHEVYFVIATTTFLSAYQDQLPLAIANVRKLEESVKGFRKIVDPDEEFLQDIKLRENVEQEYLDAEVKVMNIFDAVENIKDHFYTTIDDPSRKGVEVIAELLEAIGKLKREFDAIKRPNLTIEKLTGGDNTPSKGSPQSSRSTKFDVFSPSILVW
ncbi:hypothetical protein LXL04_036021 [Taraxacum kok-saghyz]